MLEKIEEYLNSIDLTELDMNELQLLTEIAIQIEEHKCLTVGSIVKAVVKEG